MPLIFYIFLIFTENLFVKLSFYNLQCQQIYSLDLILYKKFLNNVGKANS